MRAERALAQCQSVDECKDWKDRATAIASYARQYNDKTLLEHCYEIRNRAKRRMGELLTATPKRQGARADLGTAPSRSSRKAIANGSGLSERTRKTALRVAAMPKAEFERRVKEPALGEPPPRTAPAPGVPRDMLVWEQNVRNLVRLPSGGLKVVDVRDVPVLLEHAEKALKNITAWAVMLKKAKRVR